MNMQRLRERQSELIANMKGRGYSVDYIDRLKREIDTILSNADGNNWQSYGDIYSGYVKQGMTKAALQHRLARLGIIERFAERGEFPDGKTRQKIVTRGKEQYLLPELKSIIDAYREHEFRRGAKKTSTICSESSIAASFLHALQCAGISSATDITQQSVIAVFMSDDGTIRWSHSYKKALAMVFRANVPADPELFTRIIAYLPDLRERRKNIQYLTDEEVSEVKRVLTERNSGLSLRDRAIGALALNYGLRCCDIAALKLDDIDLISEKISITQQKTAVPQELPLTTVAGNAVYDYVAIERPKNDCEYVFLVECRPYGRLAAGSLGNIAGKIMKVAGIRQNAGDRKGFHIFRHRLATALLGNGVAPPVISKIAGQTAPDSLEPYLGANFKQLKECAISIERYPVAKGVFANA